ncbi:hypothetical protein [Bdellovibrio reynosensis]|uniref:Uncharacterized protein n=1 Tax=Bdellovibrio reynosensis TaxID=2835041 RepID=A0ABY4C7I1_9BACT|nr:hypothetical protein [Bdellovibrio reynosensis]UOF00897.1 hypothetical protein MNR06_14440 [Bdellovibrio reynosensis]
MKSLFFFFVLFGFNYTASAYDAAACANYCTKKLGDVPDSQLADCMDTCPDDIAYGNMGDLPGPMGNSSGEGAEFVPTPPGKDIEIKCEEVCPGDKCPTRCHDKYPPPKKQEPGTGTGSDDSSAHSEVIDTKPCEEDFSPVIEACESAVNDTSASCDENSSSLSKVSDLVSQAAVYIGQKSASSVNESCSKMATLSKGVSAGLMLYRQTCNSGIKNCVATCSVTRIVPMCGDQKSLAAQTAARKALNQNRNTCSGFTGKMNDAQAAAQNYSQITMNSQDCASLTAGAGTGPTELCMKNPDYPGCGSSAQEKMDCTHPSMANNKVCVCRGNPNHSMCRSSAASNSLDANSELANRQPKSSKNNLDLSDMDQLKHRDHVGVPDDPAADGKQGSDPSLSSKLGAAAANKKLKSRKNISDRSVLGGFYGGSAAAKPNTAEPVVAIESAKKTIATDEPSEEMTEKEKIALEELRKFLPGQVNAPARGLAGTTEKVGEDGITGPHSNIWEKVKNRYESVKSTLLP